MPTFLFGSDPEFALVYKNQFKSAISVLPEKEKAVKENGNSFYFDNVLAEVGVRPTGSRSEAVGAINDSLHTLARLVRPATVVIQASMKYPTSELKSKKAQEAGCVPEISAYTLARVVPPEEYVVKDKKTEYMKHVTPVRTVGGHIHLGANDGPLQHGMLIPYVVKMLDLFLAVPNLFINKDKTAGGRRKIYGKAGTHRNPEYGVEYRPLSNDWLSSPVYVELAYDICEFVLKFVEEKGHERFWQIDDHLLDEDDPSIAHRCYGYNVETLRNLIDSCDKKSAESFLLMAFNYLPARLIHAVERAVEYQPADLYEEWGIK